MARLIMCLPHKQEEVSLNLKFQDRRKENLVVSACDTSAGEAETQLLELGSK